MKCAWNDAQIGVVSARTARRWAICVQTRRSGSARRRTTRLRTMPVRATSDWPTILLAAPAPPPRPCAPLRRPALQRALRARPCAAPWRPARLGRGHGARARGSAVAALRLRGAGRLRHRRAAALLHRGAGGRHGGLLAGAASGRGRVRRSVRRALPRWLRRRRQAHGAGRHRRRCGLPSRGLRHGRRATPERAPGPGRGAFGRCTRMREGCVRWAVRAARAGGMAGALRTVGVGRAVRVVGARRGWRVAAARQRRGAP
jgi:hypothetical protein